MKHPMTVISSPTLRLDKWLWSARFYKTRSLAADAIGKGRIQVNGVTAKASRELRPGDSVVLQQDGLQRSITVLAISAQRGPASVAQLLYAETPESVEQRLRVLEQRRLSPEPARSLVDGRPTKRDRREIERERTHSWNDRWSASVDD